jgi:hypothetical protein
MELLLGVGRLDQESIKRCGTISYYLNRVHQDSTHKPPCILVKKKSDIDHLADTTYWKATK